MNNESLIDVYLQNNDVENYLQKINEVPWINKPKINIEQINYNFNKK